MNAHNGTHLLSGVALGADAASGQEAVISYSNATSIAFSNDTTPRASEAKPDESGSGRDPCEAASPEAPVRRGPFFVALLGVLLIVFLYWSTPPVSLVFDPNKEQCLPELHLGLMFHSAPSSVKAGDLVFWRPFGPLSYIRQQFVIKRVAGVAGDHLVIRNEEVSVNGVRVVSGLPLKGFYKREAIDFERDERIPSGKVFVIGTHPHSDDSRYWGYLEQTVLEGTASVVF